MRCFLFSKKKKRRNLLLKLISIIMHLAKQYVMQILARAAKIAQLFGDGFFFLMLGSGLPQAPGMPTYRILSVFSSLFFLSQIEQHLYNTESWSELLEM